MAGEFSKKTRELIIERAEETCERCHVHPASDIHHRCPRKSGGSSLPWMGSAANGVALCRACHAWAEANRDDQAFELGWRVRQGEAEQHDGPGFAPVIDTTGRIWLLYDDGTKITC